MKGAETEKWRIVDASLDDFAQLAVLDEAIFGERAWGERSLAQVLAANGASAAICSSAGNCKPVGFAIWRSAADECELILIGVVHSARKMGAGACLLEYVKFAANAQEAEAIFLEVSKKNDAALQFYRKVGFEEVGRRPRYYRDGADAILMRALVA